MTTLEIRYNGIREWLEARNKLPTNWATLLKGLHSITSKAIADNEKCPPPADCANYLTELTRKNQEITYVEVAKYIAILLKTPEAEKKNILGGYSSPHLLRWLKVQKGYLKNNLYLVDAARRLYQNTSFEIPSTKALVDGAEKQIQKLRKRRTELDKLKEDAVQRYNSQLAEYGTVDTDVRAGLHDFVKRELPVWLDATVTKGKCLHPAWQFYLDFSRKHEGAFTQLPILAAVLDGNSVLISDAPEGTVGEHHVAVAQLTHNFPEEPINESLINSLVNRQRLMNDVFELKAFLDRRIEEQSNVNVAECDEMSTEQLKSWQSHCANLLEIVGGKKARRMFQLKDSSSFFESTVCSLATLAMACVKPNQQKKQIDRREKELREEAEAARKEIKTLRQETIELKESMEQSITNLLGMKCKITGEINRI